MAVDDNFKILLKPTLDFNKEDIKKQIGEIDVPIKIIPPNIKNLQSDLNKLELSANISLVGVLNVKKTQTNINNALKKINLNSINLVANIDDKKIKDVVDKYNKNIKDIQNSTKNIPISNNKGSLISESIKQNESTRTVTNTYRNEPFEIEKISNSYDALGNKIKETSEITREYEKTSQNLAYNLSKNQKELIQLEVEKAKAIKNGVTQVLGYDEAISKKKEQITELEKQIKELSNIGVNIKNSDTSVDMADLKSKVTLYKELKNLENELFKIEKSRKNASEEDKAKYDDILASKNAIIERIRTEIQLLEKEDSVLEEQVNTQRKLNELKEATRDKNRLVKLGEAIDTSSYQTQLSYSDASETSNLEAFVKEYMQVNNILGKFEGITATKTKIQDLNNEQKQFTASIKTGKGQVTDYTFAIDKASQNVFEMGNKVRRVNSTIAGFNSLLNEMVQKVVQWNIATNIVFGTLNLFGEGLNFIVELDSALTQVALVTNKTKTETEGLKNEYVALAKETKKTVNEIANVNVELIRQGLSAEETQKRMNTILKLSSVGDMSTEDTLSIITSSVNALGEEAKKTADVLVYADNASASSVQSIGTALTKVASTAKDSGLTIEQLTGQVATLIDVTQEAPETLGNSLKSMMARFSKINELGEVNKDLNDVQRAFESVGIAFTDAEGQIRPFYDLMTDMASKWSTLDKNTKAMVATLSAGTQQQNRFLVLMQNWDRVQSLTSELENNASGSLDRGYSVWTESLQAKLNDLKISVQEFWISFLDSNQLSSFLDVVNSIVKLFAKIETSFSGITKLINGIIHYVTWNKIIKDDTKIQMIEFMKNSVLSLSNAYKNLNNVENKNSSILKQTITKIKENITALKNKEKSIKDVTKALKNQNAEENKTNSKSVTKTGSSNKSNSTVTSTLVGGLGALLTKSNVPIALLSIATSFIQDMVLGILSNKTKDVVEEFKASLGEVVNNMSNANQTYSKNVQTLEDLKSEYKKLVSVMGEENNISKLSTSQKEKYFEITSQIAELFPDVVSYYDEQNRAVLEYGVSIDDLINKQKELYNVNKTTTLFDFQKNSKNYKDALKDIMDANTKIYQEMGNILYDGKQSGLDKIASFIVNLFTPTNFEYEKASSNLEKIYEYKNSYLQKQQAIVKNPSSSEEEIKKAQQRIDETKNSLNLLNQEIKQNNLFVDEYINYAKQMLSINISDYFNEAGDALNDFQKSKISETAGNYLAYLIKDPSYKNKEFALNDTISMVQNLISVAQELQNVLNDKTQNNILDNVDDLKELENQLISLGMDKGNAQTFIDTLSAGIASLGNEATNTASKISDFKNFITQNYEKISSLQEIVKKASTGSLSFDEVMSFMESGNETDVIDKLNEGLTIQNAIREVALEQIEKLNEEENKRFESTEKNILNSKNLLEQEKKSIENSMKALEEKGSSETETYANLKERLDEVISNLATLDSDMEKNRATIDAYNQISNEFFDKNQFDAINEQFTNATNNIKNYKEMLDTLNTNGLTQDLLNTILSKYPDLIGFIDSEVSLRNYLNQLITQEQEIQKQSYMIKLQYNANFTNAFIKNNDALISKLSEKYNIDLRNFKTIQEQKMGILGAMNQAIARQNIELSSSLATMSSAQLTQQKTINQQKITSMQTNSPVDYKTMQQIQTLKAENEAIDSMLAMQTESEKLANQWTSNIKIPTTPVSTSSGGGGSSSVSTKKTKLDLVELEKEEYLKLNKAIEENNRLQDRNSQLQEYAIGEDKIKLMQEEINILSERQKLDSQLATQYRQEQKSLRDELSKTINMENNGFDSYTAYMKNKENEINSIIKQINNTTNESTVESLTEKKDAIQKEVDKIAEQYKKYIEITFSSIPELQDDYTNIIFEKFDKSIEMMQTKVEKYSDELDRLNKLRDYRVTGKNNNISELEYELKIYKEINSVLENEIKVTEEQAKSAQDELTRLEGILKGITDTNSQEYKNADTNVNLAKAKADEALALYEASLDNYASNLNSKIQIEVDLLTQLKDKTKESLSDLRKEIDNYTFTDFNSSLESIRLELDKIDGIFVKNPQIAIDTTPVRNQIKEIASDINTIRNNTEKWKQKIDSVVKSNKTNREIIEEIQKMTETMIKEENSLNELIQQKNEELSNLKIEYTEIENSLQNQIDLKNEELSKIQEEYNQQTKINSLIETRLKLVKALDDTSYMYVNGQGEVEWTFNKSEVDNILSQLDETERQQKQEELVASIEDEISKMQENLDKTKEIHQQNLAANEAQLSQLEQERDYLSSVIDANMEQIDNSFNNMIDKYIEEQNKLFQENTNVLINIYDLLKSTTSQGFSYASLKSTDYSVGKNETLSSIATKFNTTVDKLLQLNPTLSKNSQLAFGQNIKIPSFDTGGYTGDFGKEGRLAILHQKELVLNQNDTQKFFKALKIASDINRNHNINNDNSNNSNTTNIVIEGLSLNGIQNPTGFINQMSNMARSGIRRLN